MGFNEMYQSIDRRFSYTLLLVSFYSFKVNVIAAELSVITKSQWNGVEPTKELTKQSLPIGRVIILHTAGVDCQNLEACSQKVRNIQNYHLNLHFDDIGYNFLIGNDGNVYEGRGWEFVGAAVRNFNNGSVSLAFIGEYDKKAPSEQALQAAQQLLDMGVSMGMLMADYKLYGHRQLQSTSSPGAALYEIIKQWPHWSRTVV